MTTSSFQRTAVATAVSAVLTAGMSGSAYALAISAGPGSTKPTLNTVPFVGTTDSHVRVTGTNNTDTEQTAKAFYFDAAGAASGTPVGNSLAAADTAGAGMDLMVTVNIAAGVTTAAVIVDAGPTDTIGGDRFAYVDNDTGALVGGFATENDAITGATTGSAGDGLLPVDDTYRRISMTDAQVDLLPGSSLIYVTFNADPNIAAGPLATSGSADKLSVKAGLTGVDTIVSDGSGGTPAFGLPENIKVLLEDVGGNAAGTATGAVVAFTDDPTEIENAGGLDDGAGNEATVPATISPIFALAPPDYAADGGQVAMAGNANEAGFNNWLTAPQRDGLYSENGSSVFVFYQVRLNEAVVPVSFTDAGPDVQVYVDGVAVTPAVLQERSVQADADGKLTILEGGITPPAGTVWFIDPVTGDLLNGLAAGGPGAALPVSIAAIVDATTNPIQLALNSSVELTTDLAPVQVVANFAQDAELITQDTDKDGWVDGGILNFQQAVTVPFPGDANIGLVSYTGTPEVLVASLAAGANAPEALLVITNKDVPNPDGTAPATAQNDWDGSGTVDAADAALVTGDNFNTGVFNTKAGVGAGLPFEAFVGINDVAAPETGLTYAVVYNFQTGENLEVPTGPVGFSVDGSDPVVKAVEFQGGNAIVRASEDVQARDFIADDSRDAINEFLFGGVTADLLNVNADPAILDPVAIEIGTTDNQDLNIAHGGDEIILTNMPPSIIGQTLSLGVTGGAEDLAGNPLFLLPGVQNDVVEPDPEGPAVLAVRAAEVGGKWDRVIVTFDQVLQKPAGQTAGDLDAVFTVRAIIGWDGTGGAAADNMEVFQWIIAGADVSYAGDAGNIGGLDEVTLKLPGSNVLPPDTVQIFADYQGASETEVDDGSLSFVGNVLDAPAKIDGGSQFDNADPGVGQDVPMKFTAESGTETFAPFTFYAKTVADEDTAISQIYQADFIEIGGRTDDQRRLFTQTIKGAVTNGGEQAFEDTAVRADVIRLNTDPGLQIFERKAAVSNGWIEVRQGSNSEYSDEGPHEDDNDSDENNWVNMALLNKAVTGSDVDKWLKAANKVRDLHLKYDSAVENNKDTNSINNAYANWQREQVSYDRTYRLNPDDPNPQVGYLLAYVQITSGAGGNAVSSAIGETEYNFNTAQANGNASYGRTATLQKTLPSTQKNGTSFYPVWVKLGDLFYDDELEPIKVVNGSGGALVDASSSGAPEFSNNVRDGELAWVDPILGDAANERVHFESLDTAYALVDEDGNYKITVSMDQEAFNANSKDLNLRYSDACILIKVKNTRRAAPQPGDWLQANSCDQSFDANSPLPRYLPFEGDLNRDGSATMLDINVDNISRTPYIDDGDWFLAAVDGTPARDASKALDLPWFFIQTRPSDGATVSLWGHDHGYGDSVATLGLNQGKDPSVQLAFELGDENDNRDVGSLKLRPGAALAILGDGQRVWYTDVNDTGDQTGGPAAQHPAYDPADSDIPNRELLDSNVSADMLYVPVTGDPQNAVLAADAWHLVTFDARGKTLGDIAAAYPGVDAMIIFHNPVSHLGTGRDDAGNDDLDGDVDTTVWFLGETPPPTILGDPIGAFIHASDEIDPFNIHIP